MTLDGEGNNKKVRWADGAAYEAYMGPLSRLVAAEFIPERSIAG